MAQPWEPGDDGDDDDKTDSEEMFDGEHVATRDAFILKALQDLSQCLDEIIADVSAVLSSSA